MEVYPILQNKVAIVTGAAQGMGEATAMLFAEAQAKVIVADFNEEKALQVVSNIKEAGGEASFIKVDVSDEASVEYMVSETVNRYGRLDVAVNNAAVQPDTKEISEMDLVEWNRILSVDLTGVALCMKYQIRQLIKQNSGGSIVNISSTSGFRPQPSNGAYVAAKHGVVGITKVAALDYGKNNIRVNSVAPGAIETPMLFEILAEKGYTPEERAPLFSVLNRYGQPKEVAQASLWLASDYASYVTGSTIHVDAGYVNR